jgi:hypothetical protein
MAGLSSLTPWGMVASAAGAGLNLLGAIGQNKEAKKQLAQQKAFGTQQRAALSSGYGDLMAQAKGLPTYQGDISLFQKAQDEAEMAKRMASGGQVAGEGIMREQARQTTANTLAAARLGAGSGSDLLTAALMGQQQEGAQMQNIDLQVGERRSERQRLAQQNLLATLGQTAAAQAQQAGLQFESEQQKAQQILGLGREQLGQSMNLEQNLFQSEQAKAAAVAQARAAIWSGIGGIAGSVGSGLMGMGAQQNQMDMLKQMYPSGAEQAMQKWAAPKSGLGLGAFFGSKQATTGVPTSNVAAYSAPMIFPSQPQTDYSNLLLPRQ